MTSTETTLTPSTLSMADAVYLRLPRELQRSSGGHCTCGHCGGEGLWDTLVVPTTPVTRNTRYSDRHSYTVHMPDGAVAGFVAYVARKAKEARGQ
jgi:hypothetical protein